MTLASLLPVPVPVRGASPSMRASFDGLPGIAVRTVVLTSSGDTPEPHGYRALCRAGDHIP